MFRGRSLWGALCLAFLVLQHQDVARAASRSKKPSRSRKAPVDVSGAAAVVKPSGRPLTEAELTATRKALGGTDTKAAQAAAKKLGESGAGNAIGPLSEQLALGTTPIVAQEILSAMQQLRNPAALQIMTLYAGNRNVTVRTQAVKALAALADPRVVGTLIERLGDSAPDVRKAAAEALGERKEVRAADRLFKLVARNDLGAAGPFGVIMTASDVPRVSELRGRVDDGVVATALGEFIKRPEVADRLRYDVVKTLGQIPGAVSTAALVEYVATAPEKDPRPSRDEAQKLIDRRGGK